VQALSKIIGPLGNRAMMIIDESTTIKNRSAKRNQAYYQIRGVKAKYKRILTGSPITKSPLDLFSQCAFLNTALLGL
jgi:SNF2 family DNA or RNA helicase